jgi:hypothetical protein
MDKQPAAPQKAKAPVRPKPWPIEVISDHRLLAIGHRLFDHLMKSISW